MSTDNVSAGGLPALENPSAAANAVQGAAQEYTAGAPVKSSIKGAPFNTGNTVLDPRQTAELLANMQEMIAQKTGGWNQFMSGLKDAAAWAVPGIGGQKQLALSSRDEQKRAEAQDVYNMRSQMASLRSAQELAAQDQAAYRAAQQGGAGGAGGAGGGLTPEAQAYIESFPMSQRPQAWRDMLKTQATEGAKFTASPAAYEQKPFYVPELDEAVDMNAMQVRKYQTTGILPDGRNVRGGEPAAPTAAPTGAAPAPKTGGVNQFNVGNVRPAGATTGFQQPGSYQEGIQIMDNNLKAYGDKGVNTLRGVISRWAPPNENDTEALIKNAAQRLGINPDQKIDLSNPVQRQAIGTAIMLQEKGPQGIFSAPTAAPKGKNIAQIKAAQKVEEETALAPIEGLKEQSRGAGKATNELFRFADEASRLRPLLKKVREHSENYADEFAVASRPGTTMGAAALAGQVMGGAEGRGYVEENLPSTLIRPGAKERRDETANASTQIGIKAIPDMFSGNGSVRVGAQISNLVQSGKGLGLNISADANTKFSKIAEIGLDRAEMMANALKRYRETSGNPKAMIDDLPQSTLWKIDDWTEKQFEERGIINKLPPQEAAAEELRKRKIRNVTGG